MSCEESETLFFERETHTMVQTACDRIIPGCDVQPRMFDAGVTVRHGPGEGPTIEQADKIAEVLRNGRPLIAGHADWHVSIFGPYCDALDPNIVYGTSFGIRRAFVPTPEALQRAGR